MRFLPILLLAALAACGTSSSEPSGKTSDSGKTYDQLVSTYGPPDKVYDLISGAQLVQYSGTGSLTSPSGVVKERGCIARFWLYDRVVKTSTYDGDDEVCQRMQKGGRGVTTGRQPVSYSRQPYSNSQLNNILEPVDKSMNAPTMDMPSSDPPIDPAPKVWGDVP